MYVFDLATTEPTEAVQKVELQLDPSQSYRYSKGINVSFYSLTKQSTSKTYLGTGRLINNLNLPDILGSHFLDGITRLGVQIDGELGKPLIGLVLYSKNTAIGYAKAHDLSRLLFETSLKSNDRRKRSLDDNEVDVHVNFSNTEEIKSKKKKKKTTKTNKIQVSLSRNIIRYH